MSVVTATMSLMSLPVKYGRFLLIDECKADVKGP